MSPKLKPPEEVLAGKDISNEGIRGHYQSGATGRELGRRRSADAVNVCEYRRSELRGIINVASGGARRATDPKRSTVGEEG